MVAEDSHHNAAPGAFILASHEKASLLAEGLRHVAAHVPNEKWDPHWMTDKDTKEHKALKKYLADIFTKRVTTILLPNPFYYSHYYRCFYANSTLCVPGKSN